MTTQDPAGLLREQGVSLQEIDARLASGYAEFKRPLMVAVADVSALRAALAATDSGGPLDVERLKYAVIDVFRELGTRFDDTARKDGWPAYIEQGREPRILLVNDVAEALAARDEVLRLLAATGDSEGSVEERLE